ncbi:unnamed protein product [Phytophthora fragariaefolia]|uniref:Unnamed protein product n=1 Tax=Phytophthora fragariaefolia TaxID=1490495 RepID=A0A9W6Y5P6_9STRA|nr:unnamed protein product [Phytophthora fragariaefolia]
MPSDAVSVGDKLGRGETRLPPVDSTPGCGVVPVEVDSRNVHPNAGKQDDDSGVLAAVGDGGVNTGHDGRDGVSAATKLASIIDATGLEGTDEAGLEGAEDAGLAMAMAS